MDHSFDPITIILLVAAVIVFFKLRSVLGSRTGHKRRENFPPSRNEQEDNVITLPPAGKSVNEMSDEVLAKDETPAKPVWQGFADEGSELAEQLQLLVKTDNSFTPASFLEGSKAAYEMVVTAFAEEDTKTLKNLLSKEVYQGFEAAIDERVNAGHKMETRFVGIDDAKIMGAELSGSNGQVTVRFKSELVTCTHDEDGSLIDGDPNEVRQLIDVWTFERPFPSRDPNWQLISTEEAA